MNNVKEYFQTDWAAMTFHDWLGMGITIIVFIMMIAIYVYIFHPANKEKFESQRFIPLNEDRISSEDKK